MPLTGEGTSALTLSVSTSSSGSNSTTLSPGFTSQREMVPSWTDSPSCGMTTRVVFAIANDVPRPRSAAYFATSAAGAKETTSTQGSASRRCVTERAQKATLASAKPGRLGRCIDGRLPGRSTQDAFGVLVDGSARGRRLRLTACGTALNAMPQLGQKPDATMCI